MLLTLHTRGKTLLERLGFERSLINQTFPRFSSGETGWRKARENFDLSKLRADQSRSNIVFLLVK